MSPDQRCFGWQCNMPTSPEVTQQPTWWINALVLQDIQMVPNLKTFVEVRRYTGEIRPLTDPPSLPGQWGQKWKERKRGEVRGVQSLSVASYLTITILTLLRHSMPLKAAWCLMHAPDTHLVIIPPFISISLSWSPTPLPFSTAL